jgi:hypothetical protein
LSYYFVAVDTSGNWYRSPTTTVEVVDNQPPELIEDLTPSNGTTGDPFSFVFTVADNIGVNRVELEYWYSRQSSTRWSELGFEDPSGTWSLTIVLPTDEVGTVQYRISIFDEAENHYSTALKSVELLDNDAPIIGRLPTGSIIKGLSSSLEVDVEDNFGVDTVRLEYWFGDGEHMNVSTSNVPYTFSVYVPRKPDGEMHYFVAAEDEAGNKNSTHEFTIILLNTPPEWDDIPIWPITEEQEETLDLTSFLSDSNDEVSSLTIECDDDNIIVEGIYLKARYDEAVADWTITLTASDGEDDVETNVIIHIVNVNDDPVIISLLPENETKFKEGEPVTFTVSAADEDGDELIITWVSDGKTLGTGTTFDYKKLKPGTRVITVRVFDGVDTTEQSTTVIIKKEEESPGFGGMVAIVVIMIALVSTSIERGRRRT